VIAIPTVHGEEVVTITGKSYRPKNRSKGKIKDSGDDAETCPAVPP